MNILFVHQNFSGQYLHVARHLGAQPGNRVVFITQRRDASLSGGNSDLVQIAVDTDVKKWGGNLAAIVSG